MRYSADTLLSTLRHGDGKRIGNSDIITKLHVPTYRQTRVVLPDCLIWLLRVTLPTEQTVTKISSVWVGSSSWRGGPAREVVQTMSLVTYSDSDDESDQTELITPDRHVYLPSADGPKRKRSNDDQPGRISKPPPPLPTSLTNLYASNVRSSTYDSPTLHQGRKRQIPHVEGNWPSFVYLEWLPSVSQLARLEDLIAFIAHEHNQTDDPIDITTGSQSDHSRLQQQVSICSSLRSDLGVRQPLHVSLSAPLILTTDNKDTFLENLTRDIESTSQTAFTTFPSTLKWVTNFDGTRHFLIVTLKRPKSDALRTLLDTCNRTTGGMGLPQLYAGNDDHTKVGVVSRPKKLADDQHVETPVNDTIGIDVDGDTDEKFHISIAWSLEKVCTNLTVLQELRKKLEDVKIMFDKVFIKIGNQVSSVSLQEPLHRGEPESDTRITI